MKSTMYWVASVVISVNAAVSAGFAIANVLATGPSNTSALYALVRTLPLAVAAIAHVFVHSPASLCTMTLLLGTIQLGDFAIGIYLRDATKTAGPLLLALLTLACAIPLTVEQAILPGKNNAPPH